MRIPQWAWLVGGAVVGYFALQQFAPDVLNSIQSSVSGAILSVTGGTGVLGVSPNPAANISQSNRVSYYNPQNMYRSNVAYGYGPQSSSGAYNSFRFTDF